MIHLGMSGNLRVVAPSATVMKHDHVDILFDENTVLRFQDPRRFGCVIWLGDIHEHKLLANLGPEPLSDDFNTDYLNTKAKNKRVAVKLFVVKQETVTGIDIAPTRHYLPQVFIHKSRLATYRETMAALCNRS